MATINAKKIYAGEQRTQKGKIMFINESKKEIIVSKAEYTKAMKVGTPEFEDLFRAKQLCPRAKIIIKKSDSKQHYKNLSKKFILNYVQANNKEYLETFEKLFKSIGETYYDEDATEYKEITFFYVRRQFLEKYPQFMTESDRKKFEEAKKTDESSESNEPMKKAS